LYLSATIRALRLQFYYLCPSSHRRSCVSLDTCTGNFLLHSTARGFHKPNVLLTPVMYHLIPWWQVRDIFLPDRKSRAHVRHFLTNRVAILLIEQQCLLNVLRNLDPELASSLPALGTNFSMIRLCLRNTCRIYHASAGSLEIWF
jgi:hypothetical protein